MIGFKIGIVGAVVLLALLIVFLLAWARIFSKAGYSPVFCILMVLPVVNLISFLWFAFSTWPIEKRLGQA